MALDELEGRGAKELTALEYQNLENGKVMLDPKRAGLVMRAGKRSGKRWIFRYRDPNQDNKQVEYQFGKFPEMSVSEARDVWLQLRQMKNEGRSPRTGGGAGPALTMRQLVRVYLDEYCAKQTRDSTYRQTKGCFDRHVLPHYGDVPALKFGRDEAKAVVNKLVKAGKPRQAIRVKSAIRTLFTVACKSSYEWLPPDHQNPVFNIDVQCATPKREPVKPDTLRQYLHGLEELGTPGEVLRFQLETFARISEVTGMPWDELDLDAGIWYLPGERSKNHLAHKVMLSRQSLSRLREIRATSDSSYVFPAARNPNRPISSEVVMNALNAARKREVIPQHYTSHLSRHAGLTWIAEQGQGRDLRDRLTNHKPPTNGTDHIYNAAQLDEPARAWTQKWCDYLIGLEVENVVQIAERNHAG
ncbi:MAG: tyrosine-type recombinase/integrase [Hyphomicrobiales bacterium]